MSKFKGTKGEWKLEFNHKPKRTRLEVNAYPYPTRPDYKINIYSHMLSEDDCSVKGCGCIGEKEYDAKLIAAAPELLGFLISSVDEIRECGLINMSNYMEILIKKALD